jgi:hypothetical protein
MHFDRIIAGGTVVFPDAEPALLDVAIRDGRIAALLQPGSPPGWSAERTDATGRHVFPGLIDAHVHFGFAEPVTEYSTETVYAAQGGFTTVLGYFLNNDGYAGVFEREIGHARARAHVDFGFHFSTASEQHLEELERYVRDYGVTSFKYFMNFRGEEGRYLGLDGTDDGYLYALLGEAARLGDVTVVLHTENIDIVNRLRREYQLAGRDTLRDWCLSKPAFTEAENVVRGCWFAEQLGATIYVPHLSSGLALDEVRRWRQRYEAIRVETCPHYLTHTLDAPLGSLEPALPHPGRRRGTLGGARRWHDRRGGLRPRAAPPRHQGQGHLAGLAGIPGHGHDPAGAARRGLPQGSPDAAAHRAAAVLGAGRGLPPADQGRDPRRARRRPDDRRPRARAHRGGRRARVVLGLQPLRRLGAEGLAGRDDPARPHRDA